MKLNKMREDMKNSFLEALKQEQIPWHQQWSSLGIRPVNAITHKMYQSTNQFWLSYVMHEKGYKDPRWCTYRQAEQRGWQVRKGEKGSRIEFWSLYDRKDRKILTKEEAEKIQKTEENWQTRIKPVSNVYTVFNAEQIEGIPEIEIVRHELDETMLRQKRDVLIQNMNVSFREGEEGAAYNIQNDVIKMPDMNRFENEYAYMSTFLHEAGHATGHESRLNRPMGQAFGTSDYAKEELRAEIASAFTAQSLGLDFQGEAHMENHKAYIQSWISLLEEKPEEMFAAIKDAEKISDYLMEKGEFEPAKEIVSLSPEERAREEKSDKKKEKSEDRTENEKMVMKKFYNREESEQMTAWMKENISIVDVCSSLGYTPVRVGSRYYSLKEHDSVRLDVGKNSFYWNSTGEKGSVIDACAALSSMSISETYEHLYDMAGGREAVFEASVGNRNYLSSSRSPAKEKNRSAMEKQEMTRVELPKKGTSQRNVYAYLGKTRHISNDVISEFIQKDMLYQDDHNNCVFVSRDKTGEAVFACKRGTNTFRRFVADCRGNDYSRGFYVDNGSDKMFVGESVIDIMSKMTILTKEGRDYHEYNYLALAGTGKQEPIKNICSENPQIKEVIIGLDHDDAGWMAALSIEQSFKESDTRVSLDMPKKSGQDWNDILREREERDTAPKTDNEIYNDFIKQHEQKISTKSPATVVINAYGGPGSGKTTSCMAICAALKKEGYNAEYVQEYAKELVYEENHEMLDGSPAHQFSMLKEQMHRMDRLMGKTDFIVTDSPILLNTVYNKNLTPAYENMVSRLASHYTNFSYFMKRDEKTFKQEGRIHNLKESIQKDKEIQKLLKKHDIYYGLYTHETVDIVVKNAIRNYEKIREKEKTDNEQQKPEKAEDKSDGIDWSLGKEKNNDIFSQFHKAQEKTAEHSLWKNAPKIQPPVKIMPGLER